MKTISPLTPVGLVLLVFICLALFGCAHEAKVYPQISTAPVSVPLTKVKSSIATAKAQSTQPEVVKSLDEADMYLDQADDALEVVTGQVNAQTKTLNKDEQVISDQKTKLATTDKHLWRIRYALFAAVLCSGFAYPVGVSIKTLDPKLALVPNLVAGVIAILLVTTLSIISVLVLALFGIL